MNAQDAHGDIDPIAQLERSHRRLEEACDALVRAVDEHDLETVTGVCAFFARQVKRHEEDEDASVFPRISHDLAAAKLIEKLTSEHRAHEALHRELEDALAGRGTSGDLWKDIGTIADKIARSYRDHIALEENELFPRAQEILTTEACEEIVREMNARRGR